MEADKKTTTEEAGFFKKYGFYLALAVLAVIVMLPNPEGLSVAGQRMIGIMVFSVIVWATTAISYPVSAGVIMTLMALLIGFAPNPETGKLFGTAAGLGIGLKGFASTAFCLVAAAMFLAVAMTKTGLDKRIALVILSKLGAKSNRVVIGVILCGFILSFFVPSTTARVACLVPIVMGMIKAFDVPLKSKFAGMLMITVAQVDSVWNVGIKTAAAQNMVAVNFISPYSLMCEYLSEPLGIDMSSPRLSWKIPVVKTDSVKSCRVWVSADSMAVINGSGQCWDSGELPSDIRRIVYAGDSLQSWTKYYWKVGYKTKREDRFVCSPLSSFTTGMMSPKEWGDARWISDDHDKDYRPSPYFRKDFEVRRNVKHAYAVIAAAGLYELSVNGSRIGDHFLDPMYTHFDKRVLSVMYDITPNLSEGENVIGVQLGNGWYNHQSTAVWFFDKASWRNRPAFIMQAKYFQHRRA